NRILKTLRRMMNVGRQKEDLACLDGNILGLAIIHDAQDHVSFELIKKLLARIVMVVFAGVGTADHHDDEIAGLIDLLVANGRLEMSLVGFNPLLQVSGGYHASLLK